MYRRKWNEKSKKSLNVKTDNIVIIMKGENLSREICIFDNRVKLRVRPYIQSVRQCYNCYKFGHIKQFYKSNTVCINCGREAHGLCEVESCCCNCGGGHRSRRLGNVLCWRKIEILIPLWRIAMYRFIKLD